MKTVTRPTLNAKPSRMNYENSTFGERVAMYHTTDDYRNRKYNIGPSPLPPSHIHI